MSGGYVNVFGGGTIYPSSASYLAISLDADVSLSWPLEAPTNALVVANIIDVDPSGSYVITMPSALQGSNGTATQISNLNASTFIVEDFDGNTLISIAAGESWTLYLQDNSTAAGEWRSYANGIGSTPASAAALAGFGLIATGSTLSQSQPTTLFNMSGYALGAANRAGLFVWTGGVGTATVPSGVGANWFASIRNGGSGNLTVTVSDGSNINGSPSLVLVPGDSATFNTDGSEYFTVGLGQQSVFAFDYTSIDITGQSTPYVLSGSQLNRIAYKFIGTLTGNIDITLPGTTQQYWVDNSTTGGSYTLSIGVTGQVPYITVPRGSRGIYYSDGTSVVNAATAGIATPISITDGGTGSTTASGARINLGGTSVGIAVFTASTTGGAQTSLGATATGAALFTAANAAAALTTLGISTPFSIANGGTGQTTASAAFNALSPITTAGDLILGNGANSATRLGIGANDTVLKSNGTTASWGTVPTSAPTIPRSARTSNTILGVADQGKFIDITSGTFSQTFDAAATLGAGWFVYIANNGTGVVTLDANGSETLGSVNAATTAVLAPGQGAIVESDGSNLYFPIGPTPSRNIEIFTASGTFTPKPGVVRYWCRVKGGGGNGFSNPGNPTGGGGEASEVEGFVDITSPQTITVGANGAPGGTSSIGTLVTAPGGAAATAIGGALGGSPGTTPSTCFGSVGQSGGPGVGTSTPGPGGGSGHGKGGDGQGSGLSGIVVISW